MCLERKNVLLLEYLRKTSIPGVVLTKEGFEI